MITPHSSIVTGDTGDIAAALALLKQDKIEIDATAAAFFQTEFPAYLLGTPFSNHALTVIERMTIDGGKRLRGSLVLQSYQAFGGISRDIALRAALAIELIHSYLLIIDDFTDDSDVRRNSPSAHKFIEHNLPSTFRGNAKHFGQSVAVTAGFAAVHIASNVILDLKASASERMAIHRAINQAIVATAHGQINDLHLQALPSADVTERDIIDVYGNKTGLYTFFNPILVGALLANQEESHLEAIRSYAIPAGIAFQIQDDIIGTFGQSETSGKSNTDDLKEGKMTLLVKYALTRLGERDRQILLGILGNNTLDDSQYEKAKSLIRQSGALLSTQEKANEFTQEAIQALRDLLLPSHFEQYLQGISKYAIARMA